MFNLSDRDTKIIMILLIIAVIALPYVFYTKDTREDIEIQQAKNTQLEERYNQLQEMNKNREWYLAETARLDEARDELIASFPADIRPENYTMFLLNMEYNSTMNALEKMEEIAENEELQRPGMSGIDGNTTVFIDTVSYGDNDILPISEDGAENPLSGVVNTSQLTYYCYYDGLKYMLDYILNYQDPMIYKSIDMAFDNSSGIVSGSISLDQYAIAGLGRELPPADIWPDLDEFDIRGNVEDGIFGPLDPESLHSRIEAEELAAESAEEELPVVESEEIAQ